MVLLQNIVLYTPMVISVRKSILHARGRRLVSFPLNCIFKKYSPHYRPGLDLMNFRRLLVIPFDVQYLSWDDPPEFFSYHVSGHIFKDHIDIVSGLEIQIFQQNYVLCQIIRMAHGQRPLLSLLKGTAFLDNDFLLEMALTTFLIFKRGMGVKAGNPLPVDLLVARHAIAGE